MAPPVTPPRDEARNLFSICWDAIHHNLSIEMNSERNLVLCKHTHEQAKAWRVGCQNTIRGAHGQLGKCFLLNPVRESNKRRESRAEKRGRSMSCEKQRHRDWLALDGAWVRAAKSRIGGGVWDAIRRGKGKAYLLLLWDSLQMTPSQYLKVKSESISPLSACKAEKGSKIEYSTIWNF